MNAVAWTDRARADLQEIYDFVAMDSVVEADRLIAAGERAARLPSSGRVVPELGRVDIRDLIVRPYRVVYRVISDDEIHILAVRHGARLFPGKG